MAGSVQGAGQDAGGHMIAALDRGTGQEQLAHQSVPWRQVTQ